MNAQRIIGIVILVAGVALLVMGLNASDSVADQVSETFTGRYTDHTTWYIIGGAIMAVAGLALSLVHPHSHRMA